VSLILWKDNKMKYVKNPLVILLALALVTLVGIDSALAQGSTALERGYRTGYSDGYNAGFRDAADNAAREYQSKDEYQRADRSFNQVWGPIEDYRDGYQQGFEKGYAAGYDHQEFDSTIPTGLSRRQTGDVRPVNDTSSTPDTTTSTSPDNSTVNAPTATGSVAIPKNTILTVELLTPLSTDATQPGDRFEAKVTGPSEFAGSIVAGRVTQVKRPGKVKGVAQLQLSFEQIRGADGGSTALHAELLEIMPSTNGPAPDVDPEGGVRGRDSTKDDVAKVGAASGIGAIIGAIAGGGKGAAIGAVIGGGAGTAGVMTQKGKDLRLEQGQQMRIRTSADTGTL
jgi:hypothetical protein